MPVYSIEGKLGTGKTKFAVWRASEAIRSGRRVASNVDLNLSVLCKEGQRVAYLRIPDKPTAEDLGAIGSGNPDSYDEDLNGVLILDELGTWLNARSFQDKGRAGVLDWLIHARKFGWDVFLIVQDAGMIDRQVREALIELTCKCIRLDKIKWPVVGGLLNDMFGGRAGYLPRMHLVVSRLGTGANSVVAERWRYRGDWLHAAYDTRQVFRGDYPHSVHSVLHPDHFLPLAPVRTRWQRFFGRPASTLAVRVELKPKLPEVQALAQQGLTPDQQWALTRHVIAMTSTASPRSCTPAAG